MMCVKNYVKGSKIHSLGIFAGQFIPKGTIIWSFNPLIDHEYTDKDLATLPEDIQQFIKHYGYEEFGGIFVLPGDNARYFNHSSEANTFGSESKDGYGVTIAGRDIVAGEELTCDYNEYDLDANRKKTENQFVD